MVNITGATGEQVNSYAYDAFGKVKIEDGLLISDYQFSTKEFEGTTGLSYFGHRYYASNIGRWTTRDPIGFAGGKNFYGYAANNPINLVDPLGLNCIRREGNLFTNMPPVPNCDNPKAECCKIDVYGLFSEALSFLDMLPIPWFKAVSYSLDVAAFVGTEVGLIHGVRNKEVSGQLFAAQTLLNDCRLLFSFYNSKLIKKLEVYQEHFYGYQCFGCSEKTDEKKTFNGKR